MKTSITGTRYSARQIGTMSDYCRKLFESGRNACETNSKAEHNNITKVHEKDYVERLIQDYDSYLKLRLQIKSGPDGSSVHFDDFLPACEKLKQSMNAVTRSYLSERMKNLLKSTGAAPGIKTNDEAYIILHAINLLENKLGVQKEDKYEEKAVCNDRRAGPVSIV